jgi:hypothetical protein
MATDRRLKFLSAVLGEDGARALSKAAERSAELGSALVPRTILAWLGTARSEYEGELPGLENTYISFAKSEKGYTGSVSIGDEMYRFDQASLFHVTASVAVAIGVDPEMGLSSVRDAHIEKLGKSIDVLAKARVVTRELERKGDKMAVLPDGSGFAVGTIGKTDVEPGKAHAPTAAEAPAAPVKVQPPVAQPKPKTPKPKLPKPARPVPSYTIRLTRSEAKHTCPVCDRAQFKGEAFTGCMCLRDLAKSARVIAFEPEGVILELGGEDWDREAVSTFLESVGRR